MFATLMPTETFTYFQIPYWAMGRALTTAAAVTASTTTRAIAISIAFIVTGVAAE